ncbi:hypothetical protein EG329_008666 [Mollisiaceae sp. DMI_Dod_QoI]|nr:hypothetical protein EG329_008666 [Helotiales sp. DMI_Dod_QoI]
MMPYSPKYTIASLAVKSTIIVTTNAANAITATTTPVPKTGEVGEGLNGWSKADIIALATLAVAVVLPPVGFLYRHFVVRRWFPPAITTQYEVDGKSSE